MITLDDTAVWDGEKGTSAALIRGIAAQFIGMGVDVKGCDAYTTSDILSGSGLSSSAAFEILMVKNDIDKIIFSSTAATYGEPKNIPILESDPTCPTNPYGETKLAMERMFKWTANAHGLRYVSLRYFNACGADESGLIGEAHNPESHLIPLILQVPNKQRETISIYGTDYDTPDGTCIRDYIHVTDLAQAHILAVKYLMNGGESDIFNLGNGIGYSVREVIEAARKVTGHPIPAVESPRRAGDPARLVASSDKAKSILGWNPVHDSLDEIIASAWNWHKTHPHGYNS